jgi:hypothetical protein
MWISVSRDKRALYNLNAFDSISVFEREGRKGWWVVVGIRDREPVSDIAQAPSREEAENVLRAIEGQLEAEDLGADKPPR